MERHREPARFHWHGPLSERELPDAVLYDVALTFRHAGDPQAAQMMTDALNELAGKARLRRWPVVGARLAASGPRWSLTGRLKDDRVRLLVHHRLKGNALARLVKALKTVPGARDLEVTATVERYAKPYSSIGPCSPCAAGRFGASR